MRILLVSVAAAALLAGCARNEPVPVAPPVPAVDPSSPLYAPNFLSMAASSDQLEIQSSQLALQRSSNPGLRQIAQMLITDHTRMSQEMAAAAQGAGLTPPPPGLRPEHAQLLQQLQATPAASFDMAYRDMQISGHSQALQLLQDYANGGDTPALKTVAAGAIPTVEGHLNALQALAIAPPPPPPPAYTQPEKPGERG